MDKKIFVATSFVFVSMAGGAAAGALVALAQTWKIGGVPVEVSHFGIAIFSALGAFSGGFSILPIRNNLKQWKPKVPRWLLSISAVCMAILAAAIVVLAFPLMLFTIPSPIFEMMIIE